MIYKAIELVEREMRWHRENRFITDKGGLYEEGFIKGLEHIKGLLDEAAIQEEHDSQDQSGG